ncbi:MAG: hypothetical protein LBR53_05805 [Deltaproteobacteria bacterium]|jgi:hypothetical protein|nr:hypothetical protein [Deltaproteobacteria bacterium]
MSVLSAQISKKNQFEGRTPDSGKEETTLIDKTANEKSAGVFLKDLTRGSFQPPEKGGKAAKPASKPSIPSEILLRRLIIRNYQGLDQ